MGFDGWLQACTLVGGNYLTDTCLSSQESVQSFAAVPKLVLGMYVSSIHSTDGTAHLNKNKDFVAILFKEAFPLEVIYKALTCMQKLCK